MERRKKHKPSKHENTEVTIIHEHETLAIWISALVIFIFGMILAIFSLTYNNGQGVNPPPGPQPTGLACNNNIICTQALNGCNQGDVFGASCDINYIPKTSDTSSNCTNIVVNALNAIPTDVKQSVLLFSELIGAPPGAIFGACMTNPQMQQAVTYYCNLLFQYVHCSCTWCSPCQYPVQDTCSMTYPADAPNWCTKHMKMGFTDAPLYNGVVPYWNYPFQTALEVQQQYMLVNASYRC